MSSSFLTAEWRKLAIANYVVDSKILLPYLPYQTEFDLLDGKCYVSLVGFMFLHTKLKGIAVPFHRNFEEVNLRFYVRYNDNGTWKHGVVFIKEIVPLPALAFVANTFYKENYKTLLMKHHWDISATKTLVSYSWKHADKWNFFSVTADPTPIPIRAGSSEAFITEQHWGYTAIGEQATMEYKVEHPTWTTYPVHETYIDIAFDKLYGHRFAFLNTQKPASVMLAEGSPISVGWRRKISQ